MKIKSRSYSDFKIRELSYSEKKLLSKYSGEIKQKSLKNNNVGLKCSNLKLNLNYKKIEFRNENKDYLRIKHITNNNNYYSSISNNKKRKEYFHSLYNDENINLNNTNINNNTGFLNRTKTILSKTNNILQYKKSKTTSYKNIFKIDTTNDIPSLITNNKKDINYSKYKPNLYNEIINNKLYNIQFTNNTIDPYMIKNENKNNYNHYFRFPKKKSKKKGIKNKIIFNAVNMIRKKRNIDNKNIENKKYNNFKFSSVYKALKLEKNENKNRKWKPLINYSSIITELNNKNKSKKNFL